MLKKDNRGSFSVDTGYATHRSTAAVSGFQFDKCADQLPSFMDFSPVLLRQAQSATTDLTTTGTQMSFHAVVHRETVGRFRTTTGWLNTRHPSRTGLPCAAHPLDQINL